MAVIHLDAKQRRPRAHGGRGVFAIVVAWLLLVAPLVFSAPASAEPPLDLPDSIYDPSGALGGSQSEAQAAIDELKKDSGLQLFVAFVDYFDGASGADWAQQTYAKSGMGGNDVLLAVAIKDRKYGSSANEASGLDQATVQMVESGYIEPALGDDDWLGAVQAAAQGYAEVTADGGMPGSSSGPDYTPDSSGGLGTSVFGGIPWLFVVPVVAILGSILLSRLGNRSRGAGRVEPGAASESSITAGIPTQDLQAKAAEALVGLDNALRSAEEELTFAQAQFGQQRTEEFGQVLQHAKTQGQQAFAIRQQLDDADKETEPQERAMLGQLLAICGEARAGLDASTAEFTQMRSQQATAPQLLDELAARVAEVRKRLPVADQELAGLHARYPEQSLRTVRGHRTQAGKLLDSAEQFIAAGRTSVAKDDLPSGVAAARAAQEAIGQAVRLLDAIEHAGEDLAHSQEALSKAVASITADLQDAERLAPTNPVVQAAAQRARTAVEQAQGGTAGRDPLAALAALDTAEHDLDTVLEPMRDAEAHQSKLRGDFAERVVRVGARLRSIDETISTRRGAINQTARTRISEALRLLDQAQQINASAAKGGDQSQANALLSRAEQLGEEALAQAQQDVDRFDDFTGGQRRGGGLDPISLILGGILAGGNRHGGGWGGGGSWGGGGGFGGGGGGFGSGGGFGGGGGGISSGGRF